MDGGDEFLGLAAIVDDGFTPFLEQSELEATLNNLNTGVSCKEFMETIPSLSCSGAMKNLEQNRFTERRIDESDYELIFSQSVSILRVVRI